MAHGHRKVAAQILFAGRHYKDCQCNAETGPSSCVRFTFILGPSVARQSQPAEASGLLSAGLPKAMQWTAGRTIAQGCRGASGAEAGCLLHVALYLALRHAVAHGHQSSRLVQQDGLHPNRS